MKVRVSTWVFIFLISLSSFINAFHGPGSRWSGMRTHRNTVSMSETVESEGKMSPSAGAKPVEGLTQKEYFIAVRNRLYAVEEQIWLHDYASSRPDYTNLTVSPFSEAKYDALLRARGDLMDEYPATRLYTDLRDAQQRNMTYAALALERMIAGFQRQMPMPMDHINAIVVLSHSGQVANLMRGQGAVYHRLLPPSVLTDRDSKRQFQQPAFSNSGNHLAMAEIHFQDKVITKSGIHIYEVPKDPKTFGMSDSMPIFESGDLPSAPFFLRFSPDDEKVAMLCTAPPSEGREPSTSLVLMDWAKSHRKDSWAGHGVAQRRFPRKTTTVLKGSPVFFTYTTASTKNATIVAHCQQEVADDAKKSMVTERGVWQLQKRDTSGVSDYSWSLVSKCNADDRWSTPICHAAGGGDSVLVVEDGWLVSKSLSRWKRDPTSGEAASKKLIQLKGQAQFLVSPDNSRAVVLQEDINAGLYSLTVIEGEGALNPSSSDTGKIYELPCSKLCVSFWFSPDSTRLLLLTAAGKDKTAVETEKSSFKVPLNSDMQWAVFNFPLQELREYETFKPTPYFMKTNVPFFSQYAQVFNPWSPDSKSFVYVTPSGLTHTPLIDSKHCLGEDAWQNQGASFGTWSRT
jgi:hypothetical protein